MRGPQELLGKPYCDDLMYNLMDILLVDVMLTRTERDVVEHLLKQASHVVTTAYLLEHVWGYARDAKTRTVSTTIERIRRKIEGQGFDIQTIWGQGFCLSIPDLAPDVMASLVQEIVAHEPSIWTACYYQDGAQALLAHEWGSLMWSGASEQLWEQVFEQALDREQLEEQGRCALDELLAYEVLDEAQCAVLGRLVKHVPLELDALHAFTCWVTSSISPVHAEQLLTRVVVHGLHAQALRLSIMGWLQTMNHHPELADVSFEQVRAMMAELPADALPDLWRRELWCLWFHGRNQLALELARWVMGLEATPMESANNLMRLGLLLMDQRDPETVVVLEEARAKFLALNAHDSAAWISVNLAFYFLCTQQLEHARRLIESVSLNLLLPSAHVTYVVTNALLSLRMSSPGGARWLSLHMPGISKDSKQMLSFVAVLFESETPRFDLAQLAQFFESPKGPWSHMQALIAAVGLERQPSWPMSNMARTYFEELVEAHVLGEEGLTSCFFRLLGMPVEHFSVVHQVHTADL